DVGKRHPGVLGLPAGEPAQHVRVAENAGDRMAQHGFRDAGVRIGIFAAGEHFATARKADAASDGECGHHAVAFFDLLDIAPGLYNLAHKFVAEDVTALHGWYESAVEVQVRPADGGGRDTNNGVVVV